MWSGCKQDGFLGREKNEASRDRERERGTEEGGIGSDDEREEGLRAEVLEEEKEKKGLCKIAGSECYPSFKRGPMSGRDQKRV